MAIKDEPDYARLGRAVQEILSWSEDNDSDKAYGNCVRRRTLRSQAYLGRLRRGAIVKTYFVRWEIELDAESSYEAAVQAREMIVDKNSLATCFRVAPEGGAWDDIDLLLSETEQGQ